MKVKFLLPILLCSLLTACAGAPAAKEDRKSTRLNSSH